jgi:hypothetical protein
MLAAALAWQRAKVNWRGCSAAHRLFGLTPGKRRERPEMGGHPYSVAQGS